MGDAARRTAERTIASSEARVRDESEGLPVRRTGGAARRASGCAIGGRSGLWGTRAVPFSTVGGAGSNRGGPTNDRGIGLNHRKLRRILVCLKKGSFSRSEERRSHALSASVCVQSGRGAATREDRVPVLVPVILVPFAMPPLAIWLTGRVKQSMAIEAFVVVLVGAGAYGAFARSNVVSLPVPQATPTVGEEVPAASQLPLGSKK
jgi:hypothetical protein